MGLLTVDELWFVTLQLARFSGRPVDGYVESLPDPPPGFPMPAVGDLQTDWLLRVDAWARKRAEGTEP